MLQKILGTDSNGYRIPSYSGSSLVELVQYFFVSFQNSSSNITDCLGHPRAPTTGMAQIHSICRKTVKKNQEIIKVIMASATKLTEK